MLQKRQPPIGEDGIVVRTYAVTHPPNLGLPTRTFSDWDQLAYASRGVMGVEAPNGVWVVPPHRAVWVPAGTSHAIHLSGRVSLRTIYLHRDITGERLGRACRTLHVSGLVRELVLHICRRNTLAAGVAEDAALIEVLLSQLAATPQTPLQLPMPADPRARRVARLLTADPAQLDAALRAAGASRRTVERLFVAETGTTLGRWRRRAAVVRALHLLAEDRPVGEVANLVGYQAASAFIAAFVREVGTPPGRYFGTDRE